MRTIALIVFVSLLALAPFAQTGPMSGGFLEGFQKGERAIKKTARFRGGEKAMVLARGLDDSTATLQITVTDSKSRIVAQTTGKNPPGASVVAVFWYPPRDEDYTIDVANTDASPVSVFVTVK